ncbi:glycoside hydrolase family 26 protein [Paenarthrobacter nitroguajacolicus]|uniref:glycoside hydrolase family 26 protein n=1 Tax=Paenarthrobacter nitroguajacolicus TaxID=211146 RepID=UPI00142E99DC|nr:glycosyl hydrolase [Paenarthrobacter nitroguajacolicus]
MFRRSAGGAVIVSVGLALTGCGAPQPAAAPECVVETNLAPETGILSGVNLDWEHETLAEYAANLGRRPAVVVSFSPFPMSDTDNRNVEAAVEQVRGNGGTLLLTLEPHEGLGEVTKERAGELAMRLDGYNKAGVPVIVRFAHEMNGSWYQWGQKPADYVAAFKVVADAVHQFAPGSDMMWAPNYGGGYPFSGGQYQAAAGTADAVALDTDGDGKVSAADDPYQPYYPGDDAVDWVGMSLYHWGNTYPWGANVLPEEGKFLQQLTGTYNGAGGNDLGVPDFYTEYGEARSKPVAIPETAALSIRSRDGADPLSIKQAWWRQLFDPAIPRDFPELKMINWFEWDKLEVEVKADVDWTVAQDTSVRDAYIADLPTWFVGADEPKACTPRAS